MLTLWLCQERGAGLNCEGGKQMNRLAAFLCGMREFRSSWTTHYADYQLLETYDAGRDFAHWLTFRRFDHD